MDLQNTSFRTLTSLLTAATGTLAWGTASAADSPMPTALRNTTAGSFILGCAITLILIVMLRPVIVAAIRAAGSSAASRLLRQRLEANGRPALHDFILPGACGGLVRIDHAVMTGRGIVCVMHRSFRGRITGSENESQWTVANGSSSQRFVNPIAHNENRVIALKKALPGVPVTGVVVFDPAAHFGDGRPEGVIQTNELERFLSEQTFGGAELRDPDTAWLNLRAAALTDEDSRKDMDAQLSFG